MRRGLVRRDGGSRAGQRTPRVARPGPRILQHTRSSRIPTFTEPLRRDPGFELCGACSRSACRSGCDAGPTHSHRASARGARCDECVTERAVSAVKSRMRSACSLHHGSSLLLDRCYTRHGSNRMANGNGKYTGIQFLWSSAFCARTPAPTHPGFPLRRHLSRGAGVRRSGAWQGRGGGGGRKRLAPSILRLLVYS